MCEANPVPTSVARAGTDDVKNEPFLQPNSSAKPLDRLFARKRDRGLTSKLDILRTSPLGAFANFQQSLRKFRNAKDDSRQPDVQMQQHADERVADERVVDVDDNVETDPQIADDQVAADDQLANAERDGAATDENSDAQAGQSPGKCEKPSPEHPPVDEEEPEPPREQPDDAKATEHPKEMQDAKHAAQPDVPEQHPNSDEITEALTPPTKELPKTKPARRTSQRKKKKPPKWEPVRKRTRATENNESSSAKRPQKRRRMSEVLMLQKALETASWTDSRAIQKQKAVIALPEAKETPLHLQKALSAATQPKASKKKAKPKSAPSPKRASSPAAKEETETPEVKSRQTRRQSISTKRAAPAGRKKAAVQPDAPKVEKRQQSVSVSRVTSANMKGKPQTNIKKRPRISSRPAAPSESEDYVIARAQSRKSPNPKKLPPPTKKAVPSAVQRTARPSSAKKKAMLRNTTAPEPRKQSAKDVIRRNARKIPEQELEPVNTDALECKHISKKVSKSIVPPIQKPLPVKGEAFSMKSLEKRHDDIDSDIESDLECHRMTETDWSQLSFAWTIESKLLKSSAINFEDVVGYLSSDFGFGRNAVKCLGLKPSTATAYSVGDHVDSETLTEECKEDMWKDASISAQDSQMTVSCRLSSDEGSEKTRVGHIVFREGVYTDGYP